MRFWLKRARTGDVVAVYRDETFPVDCWSNDSREWVYDAPAVMAAVYGHDREDEPDPTVDYLGDGPDAEATVRGIIAVWAAAALRRRPLIAD
jgi:hypothetical protein